AALPEKDHAHKKTRFSLLWSFSLIYIMKETMAKWKKQSQPTFLQLDTEDRKSDHLFFIGAASEV
uniref:hypothetical protein n=1 Tax=Salmonella enterica TaxID=28901 RepID=UPI003297324A